MFLRSVVLTATIAALLAACSGAGAPLGATSGYAPEARALLDGSHSGSWMAPDAKSLDLLYIADAGTGDVDVYSYPATKLEGKLTGFTPHGLCTDTTGDVFVTNGSAAEILEYAHGGTKPIRTLSDPGYFPHNCAVDPTTGNLAVTSLPLGGGSGAIAIYRHATGKPKLYMPSFLWFSYFAGYDAKGNLFVDGTTHYNTIFALAELRAGRKVFTPLTTSHAFALPGAIQWIGKTLVVGDQVSISGPSTIYEFSLKGSSASQTSSTPLVNSCDVLGFSIVGTRLIAANDCTPNVMYFDYPAGGRSTKTIGRELKNPVGIAVSTK